MVTLFDKSLHKSILWQNVPREHSLTKHSLKPLFGNNALENNVLDNIVLEQQCSLATRFSKALMATTLLGIALLIKLLLGSSTL